MLPAMHADASPKENNPWLAYGPEKLAWKADGNYYSAEELAKLERSFEDLEITFCPPPEINVD
jgi:hypothetical protein